MSVKDLIGAAFNKDATSFESTLHAVMQEKMAAAIQSRFSPAVYEEEVDLEEAKKSEEDEDEDDEDEDEMCEDVDQIDELSKKTLGSYVKKASQHSAEVAHAMGKQKADRDDVARFTNRNGMANKQKVRDDLEKSLGADYEAERKNRKTFNKRSVGIDRAVDKLSK